MSPDTRAAILGVSSIRKLRAAVKDIGATLRTRTLTSGRVGVIVAFSHEHDDGVLAIGCLVDEAKAVDRAASLLLGLLPRLRELRSVEPEELDGDIVGARCDECGVPVIFVVASDPPAVVLCPACAARERRTERLSVALRLSILHSVLSEVASEATEQVSTTLAPALADLDRLQQALTGRADK